MWNDEFWWNKKRVEAIRLLLRRGWVISEANRKLMPTIRSLSFESPWIYFGPDALQPRCYVWHDVYFDLFGHLPIWCRERCHKVVARPRNVKELFDVYEVAKWLDRPGKCGVDRRDYTHTAYNAFWYCTSMDQGKQRYEEVTKALGENLPDGGNIPVILKKGCTEFEGWMDSNKWPKVTKEDIDFEDHMEQLLYQDSDTGTAQPEWLKARIKYEWLRHAYMIGDSTYKELLSGGDPFGVTSVTYHNTKGKKKQGR